MDSSKLILRCPACVSSDIVIVDIVIDGTVLKYYHCNECEFEWPAPESSVSSEKEG